MLVPSHLLSNLLIQHLKYIAHDLSPYIYTSTELGLILSIHLNFGEYHHSSMNQTFCPQPDNHFCCTTVDNTQKLCWANVISLSNHFWKYFFPVYLNKQLCLLWKSFLLTPDDYDIHTIFHKHLLQNIRIVSLWFPNMSACHRVSRHRVIPERTGIIY